MDNGTLDLAGLIKWGTGKALGKLDERTGLPFSEAVGPLVHHGLEQLGINTIELDSYMTAMGKLLVAGVQKNQRIGQ